MKILKPFILFIAILVFSSLRPATVLAVSCTPPVSGNLAISSDCSFAGTVNGVDSGSGTTNTATLTVNSGILTVSTSQQIAFGTLVLNGGAIALPVDGSASLMPSTALWMPDADTDGYPESATQQAAKTVPNGSAKRRDTVSSVSTVDCYGGNSLVYPGQTTYYTTDRGDGSFDYDCDGSVTKLRDVCTCSCSNGCAASPVCVPTVVVEAESCGTVKSAGPASCTRTNDGYGACVSCSGSGSTNTTMKGK